MKVIEREGLMRKRAACYKLNTAAQKLQEFIGRKLTEKERITGLDVWMECVKHDEADRERLTALITEHKAAAEAIDFKVAFSDGIIVMAEQ